jgi:P-type Ca2+ transporter type 2C
MTQELDLSKITGLTEAEAARRLEDEGYNELPSGKNRGFFSIASEIAREPMFGLLIGCGLIYLLLGDAQEAAMLLGFVFLIMGITLYQERKTERTLEALRDLSSPRALVVRDGRQRRIAGREVVRGDTLILAEGDRVPADALIIASSHLSVEESVLTGESAPVRKKAMPDFRSLEPRRPGGEDLPFVFSGTLIVRGQGVAEALAIGAETEIGKIGRALETVKIEETPLQRETTRLVNKLAVVALTICALVVIGYGVTRSDLLGGLLAGLTLAMAILPNEFPVVLTIFLALGAWRISKQNVLTRRMPAVETLGSATVLCVDKTGTLTMNRMSVNQLYSDGKSYVASSDAEPLPEEFHLLVEYAVLASQRDPFDPVDKALKDAGDHYLKETEHLHQDWRLVREYPLSHDLLALSRVWTSPEGGDYLIAAKGAPEAIADLCHFDPERMKVLFAEITALADAGLRVLGVARSRFRESDLPTEQHDFDFEFLGLIGLADPIRPTVPKAIVECYGAGIRVVMITGDYPGTAIKVAEQIGLDHKGMIITGPEMDRLSDEELQRAISSSNIFARVVPEQKLRIVNALKANGEIVAMTGDGVNDAPALKAAHIGIAMGVRGTDVAREASSLVLLDDDFSSIVEAVRLGRRIFGNLKKAMAYILAVHVPIAGMTLIPVALDWPLVLLPIHIAFLHLIIDPACSIVFEAEPEETSVMRRPPRDPREPLFGRRMLGMSLLQGVGVLAILVAVYGVALHRAQGEAGARALAFTTLIVANLGLILTNRSWTRTIIGTLRSRNAALWWVIGGATAFMAIVLNIGVLRELFKFNVLHGIDIVVCLAAGALSIGWFEVFKKINKVDNIRMGESQNTEALEASPSPNQDSVSGASAVLDGLRKRV